MRKRVFKRIALVSLILTVLLSVSAIAGVKALVYPVSHKALKHVMGEMARAGMVPYKLDFKQVKFRSWNHVEWIDFIAFVRSQKDSSFISDRFFEFTAPILSAELMNAKSMEFKLGLKEAKMVFLNEDRTQVKERLQIQEAEALVGLDLLHSSKLKKQLKFFVQELRQFFKSGETKIPLKISAVSYFELVGRPAQARLSVEFRNEAYILVMNEEDLRQLSENMSEKLRDAEIKVISKNPLRAPKLLEIRDKAFQDAENKAKASPGFPDDAYRHVYWSFLLAREFGENLAKEMADAHESGLNNPDAEKRMDLNNNAAGRRYASQGYSEIALIQKVLEDPEVMRSPFLDSSKKLSAAEIIPPAEPLPESKYGSVQLIENVNSETSGQPGRISTRV